MIDRIFFPISMTICFVAVYLKIVVIISEHCIKKPHMKVANGHEIVAIDVEDG